MMRRPLSRTAARAAALLLTTMAPAAGVRAQATDGGGFDEDRAFIADHTIFVPFRVTPEDVGPLRDALEAERIQPDTWLLVMEHHAGRLAFVMDQLAYHHVAQGELRGEPWMVSF